MMSAEERDRSHLIRQTIEKMLRQRDAAERLGLGLRQFKRLVRAWKRQGDAGLVHRQRDRASHNRLPDATRRRNGTGSWFRERPSGGFRSGSSSIGRKKRREKRVFQLRDRRPRFGELVQIDGSPHDWFESRGPRCTLIVFVDDATSRLTALRFAPVECGKA